MGCRYAGAVGDIEVVAVTRGIGVRVGDRA